MTGFEVFLLALAIISIPVIVWLLRTYEKKSVKNILTILGGTLFICIIPAIVLAWGLRSIMPEAQYVGNGNDNYGTRYIPFYDPNSKEFLSISDDYIINESDSSIYVMKINYADGPYEERPKSELAMIIPPKTTTHYSNYITKIFPIRLSNTGYKRTSGTRRRPSRYYKVDFEMMILSESQYQAEIQRNLNRFY